MITADILTAPFLADTLTVSDAEAFTHAVLAEMKAAGLSIRREEYPHRGELALSVDGIRVYSIHGYPATRDQMQKPLVIELCKLWGKKKGMKIRLVETDRIRMAPEDNFFTWNGPGRHWNCKCNPL